MNKDSLRKTSPGARIVKPVAVQGYRRVFNIASCGRGNAQTKVPSAVLNLTPDAEVQLWGALIEIPDDDLEALQAREMGYDMHALALGGSVRAHTFIMSGHTPYMYVPNCPVQKEYLDLCLEAATNLGILENFLATTYVGEETLAACPLLK